MTKSDIWGDISYYDPTILIWINHQNMKIF